MKVHMLLRRPLGCICVYFGPVALAARFQGFLLVKRFSVRISFLTLSGDVSLFGFPHPRELLAEEI